MGAGFLFPNNGNRALIIGSAILNELPDRARRPKHLTNKTFDQSALYPQPPKGADEVIMALGRMTKQSKASSLHLGQFSALHFEMREP
jgi:hypothetical protein